MTETIRYEVDGDGIALLTIDLPNTGMNVFNAQLIEDLETCVNKVLEDDAVKGAVITSGKEAFLAGADLNMLGAQAGAEQTPEEAFEGAFRLNKILRLIETGGKPRKELALQGTKPFAAAVNGLALGGGFELVLACHYRVITDSPKMQLGFPEVQVGLLPARAAPSACRALSAFRQRRKPSPPASPITARLPSALVSLRRWHRPTRWLKKPRHGSRNPHPRWHRGTRRASNIRAAQVP